MKLWSLTLILTGCAAPTSAPSTTLYYADSQPSSSVCPEQTGQAGYAYFCDAQGGISGCMAGDEPAMCDQATSTRHDCDCDSLTTCKTYADSAGNAVVGCMK